MSRAQWMAWVVGIVVGGVGGQEAWGKGGIGVVDMSKVFAQVKDGKAAKARLQKKKESFQKQLEQAQIKLRAERQAYETKAAEMTPEERAKAQQKLREQLMSLQQTYGRFSQDMARQEAEESKKLLERLKPLFEEIRKKRDLDLILVKTDATILAARLESDLTDEVIALYNQRHGGKPTGRTPPPERRGGDDPLGIYGD